MDPDWPNLVTPRLMLGTWLMVARNASVCGCPSSTVTRGVVREEGNTWSRIQVGASARPCLASRASAARSPAFAHSASTRPRKTDSSPLPYVQIPIETVRQVSEDFAFANEWLNAGGYQADIPAARQIHPGLMDLRTWLARTGGAQISAFLAAQRAAQQDA